MTYEKKLVISGTILCLGGILVVGLGAAVESSLVTNTAGIAAVFGFFLAVVGRIFS